MIPVYVNVFNRLTTTRSLCEQIANLDGAEVCIVDNASTYEPLLHWYDSCPYRVLKMQENLGHHAPWMSGIVGQNNSPFYAVTDCDLDIGGVPPDALEYLRRPLVKDMQVVKAGLSLEINDLPEWQSEVVNWERQFWTRKKRFCGGGGCDEFYDAFVDTTFALYRRDTPHRYAMGVKNSLRAPRPYTARHLPWYLECDNLDAENQYYFATASGSNSWKPDGKSLTSRFSKTPRPSYGRPGG